MKLLVIADIETLRWTHGSGRADVLVSCGDVSDQVILEAAQAYSCPLLLAVKGNHDPDAPFPPPIIDLHLRIERCSGAVFGGLNGSWRYKPRGAFLYDQEEIDTFLASFPPVHVFVSHNSPRGVHDREDDVHCGFDGLTAYVERTRPKYLFHGHQHLSRRTLMNETQVVGVYGHGLFDV